LAKTIVAQNWQIQLTKRRQSSTAWSASSKNQPDDADDLGEQIVGSGECRKAGGKFESSQHPKRHRQGNGQR
jgi:hypothetical protein